MSIFLTVLAVIGKILLILLLVVLILILYLIFTPFMYRADGAFDADEGSVFVAKLHDFSHFFGISAAYSDGFAARLTLLWGAVKIPLGKSDKADKPEKERQKKDHAAEDRKEKKEKSVHSENTGEYEPAAGAEKADEINVLVTKDGLKASKEKPKPKSDRKKNSAGGEKTRRKKEEKKPKSVAAAVAGNLDGLNFIIGKVFSLLKKISPTVLTADLDYSTGEPDTTGYVTGVLAMLPFVYGKKKSFRPDFQSEEPYVRGTIGLAGKIFLFQAVYIIIRIIANKKARDFIGGVLGAVKQQKKDKAAKKAA